MIAYRLPKADQPISAAEHPSAARLLPAGPWQYSPHPNGGTLMTAKDAAGAVPPIHSFQTGRETTDGLTYYGPKVLPTAEQVARKTSTPATVVELSSGIRLSIALAVASPRKLVFSPTGIVEGDYLTEYARIAEQLREKAMKEGDVSRSDPLLGRVVLLAIQQTYAVTEELLTDLGWVSTDDFLPIVMAAWGYDPKADGTGDGH